MHYKIPNFRQSVTFLPENQTEKETETNTNVFMTIHCNYKTDNGLRESFPKLKTKKVYNCPQNHKSQELLSLHSFHLLSLPLFISLYRQRDPEEIET